MLSAWMQRKPTAIRTRKDLVEEIVAASTRTKRSMDAYIANMVRGDDAGPKPSNPFRPQVVAVRHKVSSWEFGPWFPLRGEEPAFRVTPAGSREIEGMPDLLDPTAEWVSVTNNLGDRGSLEGFRAAGWFSLNHGIRPGRLSEAKSAGNVRWKAAAPGQADSEGKAARILYNIADAVKFCSPKHVKQRHKSKRKL